MRLKDMREDRDLTQKELASYLQISQNTYSQYENGRRQLPIETLLRLAEYFQTSTDYILELTDCAAPYPKRDWVRFSPSHFHHKIHVRW